MTGSTDDESTGRPKHTASSEGQGGRRKRVRLFTPADRAAHRVVEKQRREALNGQFIDLARLLPGLASTRRLSKSIIVSECIAHQKKQRAERLACAGQLRAMLSEQASLVAEVNTLRQQLGITERREAGVALSAEAQDVLKVDEEVFGTFPAGFGDKNEDAEEDVDDDMGDCIDAERGRKRRVTSSSARRKKTSESGSVRNASERTSSSSPARLSSWINGIAAAGSPQAPSTSTATQPALSFAPSDAPTTTEPPPGAPESYDDFLVMFSDLASQTTSDSFSGAFSINASAGMGTQYTDFHVNHLPFVQPPQFTFPPSDVYAQLASSPPAPPNEMWELMQPRASGATNALQSAGAGVFSLGSDGGFPMSAPAAYPAPVSYPSMHVGTQRVFASV